MWGPEAGGASSLAPQWAPLPGTALGLGFHRCCSLVSWQPPHVIPWSMLAVVQFRERFWRGFSSHSQWPFPSKRRSKCALCSCLFLTGGEKRNNPLSSPFKARQNLVQRVHHFQKDGKPWWIFGLGQSLQYVSGDAI